MIKLKDLLNEASLGDKFQKNIKRYQDRIEKEKEAYKKAREAQKKKNEALKVVGHEKVGTKKYDGKAWYWPHDYRHYLRDASFKQRKAVHNAWVKIGVPVKKTKEGDRWLEPKSNQKKKAWTIVRKVIAPKELGMPIPESVKERSSDDSDNEIQSQIEEKAKRDYKAEYKKFQSSTKAKKYRAELNKYNRKKGTYGNGDGKDASHKGGKIAGFEKESTNRGRREKSRLKK